MRYFSSLVRKYGITTTTKNQKKHPPNERDWWMTTFKTCSFCNNHNHTTTYYYDCSSFTSSSRRSPYAILQLRTSASKDDIKKAFRKLAKLYHPDVIQHHHHNNIMEPSNNDNGNDNDDTSDNTNVAKKTTTAKPATAVADAQEKMAELINAYEELMDDEFGGRVGDSRVALACEVYTIDELRLDRFHDVYNLQILYEDRLLQQRGEKDNPPHDDHSECTHEARRQRQLPLDNQQEQSTTTTTTALQTESILPLIVHPDDSVSDVKRSIQDLYGKDWKLHNRRLDRDQLATGWELVTSPNNHHHHQKNKNGGEEDSSCGNRILSYHLFLHNYDIQHQDIIHAVVRKYNDDETQS